MKSFEDTEKEKYLKSNIVKTFLIVLIFIFTIFYDATFSNLEYPILSSIVFFIFIIYRFFKKFLR